MASAYKQLRCPGCDGTLRYIKEKKIWECIYCGNEIRREEEYDGLYTIKNVVRMVLVDLAYQRMDSAVKNLVECQKISSDYVGTLIAEISQKVFTLITPGACRSSEARGIIGQVKRLYLRLESADAAPISAEEEALYESFEGNGDAFGVLVLVYDTLQAHAHLDFVLDLFDASAVYSPTLNASLLKYAIKNHRTEIIDQIFANADNINCREALPVLLESYEDSAVKRQRLGPIIKRASLHPEDSRMIEDYLSHTGDSIETRVLVYQYAAEAGIAPSIQTISECILNDPAITEDQIARVTSLFCKTRPGDAQLYELIRDVFLRHPGRTAILELQELIRSGIYINLSDKQVCPMLLRRDLPVSERIALLELAEQCRMDARENDAVISGVLMRDQEDAGVRMALIRKLTEYVDTISTNTLSEYVLHSTLDGEHKPDMLEILLGLDLNMSFFRGLLDSYLKKSKDSSETKRAVSRLLTSEGVSVDAGMLLQMACSAGAANYGDVAAFIRTAIQNGTRIPADMLSRYMESVHPDAYHNELIALLMTPSSVISDTALANYVVFAADDLQIKLQNSLAFAGCNGNPFGESRCRFRYLNEEVDCSLFQAYVLAAEDSAALAGELTAAMKQAGARLSQPVMVNGQRMKFKKYVSDRKSMLSPMTLALCEENNVFSLFF